MGHTITPPLPPFNFSCKRIADAQLCRQRGTGQADFFTLELDRMFHTTDTATNRERLQHVSCQTNITSRDNVGNMETFGQRLVKARKKMKLSQEALAEMLGWPSYTRISNYENGTREPALDDIVRIAHVLQVPPHILAFGEIVAGETAKQFADNQVDAIRTMFSPRVLPVAHKLRQLDLFNTLPDPLLVALDSLLVQFAELTGTPLPPLPADPHATPSPLDSAATSRLQAELGTKPAPQS